MSHRDRILALVLIAAWQSLAGTSAGQENADNTPTAAQPAAATNDDTIREQEIYIPYDKLQQVFEKEGRGVYLPYEKFQALWHAAREQTKAAQPPTRPVDALINAIENEATIADQVVNVSATLQLEILGEGWVKIPLRLREAAIRSALINGQPARLVFDPEAGHQLLYQKQGDQPLQLELKLEYTRAFTKTPGQSSVSFEAPQAPINRWQIHVPEAGMAVQIEPMIAATHAPADAVDSETKQTDLLAFVGAAPTVRITWNPKAEGASGLEAFATVQVEQQFTISEGVARSAIKLDYDISRATLNQLLIEVPANQKVVNVFDRNVKAWNFELQEGKQVIRVELFEATQGKQSLLVELEEFTDATQSTYDVSAAVVRAIGVGRQQGIVVARLEKGLQGEATKRTGLLQLDQNDLPPSLRESNWEFAYRYGAVPYELALRVEKVLPRISVTELVDAELASDRLTLNWQGLYQIKDAGLFQLRLEIPTGFEVRSIVGKAIGDAQPAAVDSHHRVADDSTTWIVNLSQRAFDNVGLSVQLQRSLSDPNLLTPTGAASTIELPLPRANPDDVEFSQGTVVLSAPESLRVNPAKVDGLRSISLVEAYQKIAAAERSSPQLVSVLAYSFAKGKTEFSVTAERRRPLVTVEQLLRAEIDSGVVKFNVSLFYDVKYSGVKSLRIDVPTSLINDIRCTNKSLRREDVVPRPEDAAEGYTPWAFAAVAELLGPSEVNLTWEQKIDELGIGKSLDIPIPRLIPLEVDRASGQIVISKSESIDIQPIGLPQGLIPIDPHNDVRPEGKVDNAAMAFTYVGDWSLQIRATRYELETSKLTSIERGLVRIVALSQGELSVQALYRIGSARQRLAIQLNEEAVFDAQPLRINGKPVPAERESATTISAPLADQDIDKTFVLELRYSIKGTPDQLDLPSFPDDPAVQRVVVCCYLPEKRVLLSSAGPWTDERPGTGLAIFDQGVTRSDEELIEEVTGANTSAINSAKTFPIGKAQRFVYSTLRPEVAPDGSLRLQTMDRRMFDGTLVILVALVGLPLFRRSLRLQLALLLSITAVLLLIGVFAPELARSIFDSIFPAAIALLVLLWLIGHISKMRWRRVDRPAAASSPFAGTSESATTDEPAAADAAAAQGKPTVVDASRPAPPGAATVDEDAQDDAAGNDEAGDNGGRGNV